MDGCRLFRYVVLWSLVVGIKNRQCPDGFYGSSCQHECPVNCNNEQCKIDEFGRTFCTDGCVDGYRGTSCRIPCPGNCQVCERFNDSCTSCKDAFHGTNCTLTCEELCQGFRCDTDQTCSKTTCLDGRYGQNCSNKCYPRYLTCARSTGNCTACRDGYYGQSCELDCPRCGFTDTNMHKRCIAGCKTTICSNITNDSGNNVLVYVHISIVILLVTAITGILILWRRSCKKMERAVEQMAQREMEPRERLINPSTSDGQIHSSNEDDQHISMDTLESGYEELMTEHPALARRAFEF